jgi:hypothetical protein
MRHFLGFVSAHGLAALKAQHFGQTQSVGARFLGPCRLSPPALELLQLKQHCFPYPSSFTSLSTSLTKLCTNFRHCHQLTDGPGQGVKT